MEKIFKIAGNYYQGKDSMELLSSLGKGTSIIVERDKNNQYDSNAIKLSVYTEEKGHVVLGYVPRTHNSELAELMDFGESFTCSYLGNKEFIIKGGRETVKDWIQEPNEPAIDLPEDFPLIPEDMISADDLDDNMFLKLLLEE